MFPSCMSLQIVKMLGSMKGNTNPSTHTNMQRHTYAHSYIHVCTQCNAHTQGHRHTCTKLIFLEEQYKKFRSMEIIKKKTTVVFIPMTLAIFFSFFPLYGCPGLPALSHTVWLKGEVPLAAWEVDLLGAITWHLCPTSTTSVGWPFFLSIHANGNNLVSCVTLS